MPGPLANDPAWLKAAFADLGLREIPGPKANPRIVAMYAAAHAPGVKDDGVAWCSAAMNYWVSKAGLRPTYSLAARSWLEWNNGYRLDPKKPIPRGAILVFRRGNSNWQGHVCLCLADHGNYFEVIGGNQSDAVTIMRIARGSFLGAMWPNGVATNPVIVNGSASTVSFMGAGALNELGDGADANAADWSSFLGQSTDTFTQLATYIRWASYVLVLISLITFGIAAWQFVKHYFRPRAPLTIDEGPSCDADIREQQDLIAPEHEDRSPLPRSTRKRRAKPKSKKRKVA